ncbi:MAG: glycosyltransferase family 9 protein [Deltaproteobacteria bacterium]|nr:glycosyltransferase family 9 protein [Deltaproteobacteria bacterium]
MRIRVLKLIDQTVGKTLCLLVGLLDALFEWTSKETGIPCAPEKILFIRPGGMGDFLYLLPAIAMVKRRFPDAALHVMCEKRNGQAAYLSDLVDDIFCYDDDTLRTLLTLLRGGYDIVIDSEQYHNLSAFFGYITRAKIRIGFKSNPSRNHCYTHLVNYSFDGQEAGEFMRLLEPLGISERNISFPDIVSTAAIEETPLRDDVHALREKYETVTVVAPRGRAKYRRWSPGKYGEVIRYLTRKPDMAVVIVGGKTESAIVERILYQFPDSRGQILSLVEKTSFLELCATLKMSNLFFGCDSGAAILAVLLGVPSVTLFGSADEKKWGVAGENHIIVRGTLPCSPCQVLGKFKACRNIDCMEKITSREVISAIEQLGF